MNGSLADSRSLSTAVVEAVADAEDVDPCDLPRPLTDAVDPDALDALFHDRADAEGQVRFRYSGYTVTVTQDRRVEVEPATPDR